LSRGHRLLAAAMTTVVTLAGCGRTALDWVPDPPEDGRAPRALLARFAVIGDYGNDSPDEARVARMVSGWNPDFIITTGDNNYPSGSADTIDANIGKHYQRFIGNYRGAHGLGSAVNRFWPSPGNHDWDDGALAAYTDYFTLPGNERYYDVTVGPVHLFALDSDPREPDGSTEDSPQARWLEATLSTSSACLDVVYFHHSAYSSASTHGSTVGMRWPFESWGADVVFAGHDHTYERVTIGGIQHITVGVSGAAPYAFAEAIPGSLRRFSGFGALLATVREDGTSFQFFDDKGTEIDTYTSFKPCAP
jgi:tartrate-resistant acid phosphatase type 5